MNTPQTPASFSLQSQQASFSWDDFSSKVNSTVQDFYTYVPLHREPSRQVGPRLPLDDVAFARPAQGGWEGNVLPTLGDQTTPSEAIVSLSTPTEPPKHPNVSEAPKLFDDGPETLVDPIFSPWPPFAIPWDFSLGVTDYGDGSSLSLCTTVDVTSSEPGRREVGSQAQTQASLKRRRSASPSRSLFPCHQCPKTFTRKKNLDDHILRHRNQREYVCNAVACLSRFNTRGDLARHIRVVHGSRPRSACQC